MRAAVPRSIVPPPVDSALAPPDELDWRCLSHPSRPNGLLIGPRAATDAVLRQLQPSLRAPVLHWPREGAPWRTQQPAATLVLHDVGALLPAEQECLLAWLDAPGSRVQVLSCSTCRVFPLVQRGVFLEQLYYRLNYVLVLCGTPLRRDQP